VPYFSTDRPERSPADAQRAGRQRSSSAKRDLASVENPVTNHTSSGDICRILSTTLGISEIGLTHSDRRGNVLPATRARPPEQLRKATDRDAGNCRTGRGPEVLGRGKRILVARYTVRRFSQISSLRVNDRSGAALGGGFGQYREPAKANCPVRPRSNGAVNYIERDGTADEDDEGGP